MADRKILLTHNYMTLSIMVETCCNGHLKHSTKKYAVICRVTPKLAHFCTP